MIKLPSFLDGTATCARPEHDPDLWHSGLRADEERAAALCRTCPLRPACADYALTNREDRGTWGGLTARERLRLRNPNDGTWLDAQGRVRRPCGTHAAYWAHRRYDETCDTCQAVRDERVEAQRRRGLDAAHAAGGSRAGAEIHRRLGEPVCVWCRAAQARDSRARRAARAGEQRPALALAS